MNSRKSQAEIIGLLIIVVIISLIMLFGLKSLLKPENDYQASYKNKDISSGMIGAILNTNSGCTKDTLIKNLLIDCAKSPNAESLQLICDDGRHSCEYAGAIIDKILDDTLNRWNMPYEFKVFSPSRNVIGALGSSSPNLGEGSTDTSTQPLPVTSQHSAMEIWLCIGGPCADPT